MDTRIRVIVKRPEDPVGRPTHIVPSLERLQELVGGYIEHLNIDNGLALICNADGKLIGLEPNFQIADGFGNIADVIVGTAVIVGVKGDQLADIPIEVDDWKDYLWKWGD